MGTLALAATYMVAEFVGGLVTNSLALLADAGHMLTDVAALGLSLFALWAAQKPPTSTRTYGYYRLEILAALVNGASLIAVALFLFVEAIRRLARPPAVESGTMLAIAVGGLAVNLGCMVILHGDRHASLNVRGVWLHAVTDTLGSVQAIAAGALMTAFGWYWADPVASLLIGGLVLFSSWGLLRDSVTVLMESVPGNLDVDAIRAAILDVNGVEALHDLHVWTITSGFVALSAHVVVHDSSADVLWRIRALLGERFGIQHSTIQVEQEPLPAVISPPPPRI
jgi:cobalt-zinc-cadmium efflux system protein